MALFNIDLFSESLGMNTNVIVVLPQKSNNQIGINNKINDCKLKTLYLLHGLSDSASAWLRLTCVERIARELGIAVVMPFAHNSWYSNMAYGFKYYDYVAKELPLLCRQFFPQMSDKPQDNMIAGNSMGGYGALKIGLCNPESFGIIGCFSGAFDVEGFAKKNFELDKSYWTSVFGDLNKIKDSSNDVYYLVRKFSKNSKNPPIYLWCGEEDVLFENNERMCELLKTLNYKATYKHSKGNHAWECWDEQIKEFLEWASSLN